MDERLIRGKIAVLLHDPPWKPWVITGDLRYYDSCSQREEGSRHECEAAELARELGLPGPSDRDLAGLVKACDRVAASFDRVLLPRSAGLLKSVMLLNIFSPDKALNPYMLKKPNADCVKTFIGRLKKLLNELRDAPSLLYHVFWSMYEPLWYTSCPGSAPPADTRVPTHTVFDHLYAAATVANIVDPVSGEPTRGCVAVVDFAGIQRWINMSRKMRDLWASSWLASLLAWKAIEGLVEEYGPDIVVAPTLRMNWFYEAWLIGKLRAAGKQGVAEELEKIFRGYTGFPGWPRHPVMPSRVTLLVPCNDPEELRRRIWESIKSAWREIVSAVLDNEEYGETIKALVQHTYNEHGGSLGYEDTRRLLEENPPLPVRIIIDEIRDAYSGYNEWLRGTGVAEELGKGNEHLLFYHYLMTTHLPRLEARYKNARIDPRGISRIWVEKASTRKNESTERARYCSVCGRLLAVARISTENDYEDICREATKTRKNDDTTKCMRRLARLISRGESLCPYCLVKRLASFMYPDIVEKTLGIARNRVEGDVYIPSTTLLAGEKDVLEKLLSKLRDLDLKPFCGKKDHIGVLRRLIKSVSGASIDYAGMTKHIRDEIRLIAEKICRDEWGGVEKLAAELVDIYINTVYGGPQVRGKVLDVLRDLEKEQGLGEYLDAIRALRKAIAETEEPGNTFILIRGDGDNMGRVVRGLIGRDAEEYTGLVIRSLGLGGGWTDEWISRVRNVAGKAGLTGKGVIVTPSYHAALSMALAATAVKDIGIIEGLGGVVVYAGGDDVLALLPPQDLDKAPTAPRAVYRARRMYWGLREQPLWFHRVGDKESPIGYRAEAYVPALAAYGRTFSVVAAHHKYPLSTILKLSAEAEARGKRSVVVTRYARGEAGVSCTGEPGKDVTVYLSTQTGEEVYIPALLPGAAKEDAGEIHALIERLLSDISSGLYSRSLIYDLLELFRRGEKTVAMELYRVMGPRYTAELVEAVVERNNPRKKRGGILADEKYLDKLLETMVCTGWSRCGFTEPRWSPLLYDYIMAAKLVEVKQR